MKFLDLMFIDDPFNTKIDVIRSSIKGQILKKKDRELWLLKTGNISGVHSALPFLLPH